MPAEYGVHHASQPPGRWRARVGKVCDKSDLFQMQLSLRWLFQYPTVASLAEKIETSDSTERNDEAPILEPVPRKQRLPLSLAQQRLWFLTQQIGRASCRE